ncbi:MAG: transglutaminase domain-containing protein, partial [Chloroflexi bacterium]|nr:transglutaminase domain-containing protein [Chloroflexota bacterium]
MVESKAVEGPADVARDEHQRDAGHRQKEEDQAQEPHGVPPCSKGADPIEHFLFEVREGHGSHFASAMTVMLRSLGIPTRLVSGYGPGVPDEDE